MSSKQEQQVDNLHCPIGSSVELAVKYAELLLVGSGSQRPDLKH